MFRSNDDIHEENMMLVEQSLAITIAMLADDNFVSFNKLVNSRLLWAIATNLQRIEDNYTVKSKCRSSQ